jgi:glycosyltransferase involved in cell wall biosynthesis
MGTMGKTGFTGLVVVIPTRNRAWLARNAIRSVLSQSLENLSVIVSDNSTIAEESNELSEFCSQLADPRLQYIRPPQSLTMTAHWQWALEQVPEDSRHVTFLTDRMVYKPGALQKLAAVAISHPDAVITYMHDRIIDDQRPVQLEQYEYSGKLYRIECSRLVRMVAESFLHGCLPRMLNSVTPRRVLGEVQNRFGNVFSSLAPDFSFCFRVLSTQKQIMYLDESLLVHYALDRSNGTSILRGNVTQDCADYLAAIGSDVVYVAAPIPELTMVHNAIMHEFNVAKAETSSPKFPEINFPKYLDALECETREFFNSEYRERVMSVVRRYRETTKPSGFGKIASGTRALMSRAYGKLRLTLSRANGSNSVASQPLQFESTRQALDFAMTHAPEPLKTMPETVRARLRPEQVD